jgi:flagellar hook-length control protein FliK
MSPQLPSTATVADNPAVADRPTVVVAERPTVVTVDNPAVVTADKPTIVTDDKPVSVVADKPTAVTADKPVVQHQNPVVASYDPPVSGQNTFRDLGGTQFIASESNMSPQLPSTATVADNPVVADKPTSVVTDKPVIVTADNPAVVTADKPTIVTDDKPVSVVADKPALVQSVDSADEPEKAAVVLQAAPVQVAAPETLGVSVQAAPEVAAVSAASARTEAIVDTVNQIVEAVVGQIVVTPSLVHGEGEVRITLKPTVLDGSDITLTAKDGTLTVAVTPATPAAEQAAAAALPRLEVALAEHAPSFRHVAVALVAKKGKIDETA